MFLYRQKVLFKHCDPAGIVFYPRYFEMINDVVEEFFEVELNMPFTEILVNNGIPTAKMDATFVAPSRHGDRLAIGLEVTRIGDTSVTLNFNAHCDKELRFSAQSVLVYTDDSGKSALWPTPLRQLIQKHMQ